MIPYLKKLLVRLMSILALVGSFTHFAFPTAKPHVITFGKWMKVQWSGADEAAKDSTLSVKVRPLLIDTRLKEFIFGPMHEVTDRLFVVQRAFRINDSLPQENIGAPHWAWERGGWLLIDRSTGHISVLNLPEFDPANSSASWYRDYAAYCGSSEDGKKTYEVVAQIGRRKATMKKLVEREAGSHSEKKDSTESTCSAPTWERSPTRVTFQNANRAKETFAIRGRFVEAVTEEAVSKEEDEESSD